MQNLKNSDRESASDEDVSRPTVDLTVLSGPDTGLQRMFHVKRVTVGRGSSNDFALSDGFVSNFHGEFIYEAGELVYRDLRSRHGSLVCVDNVSFHLHNKKDTTSIKVTNGTELQIGCTLIRLNMRDRLDDTDTEDEDEGPDTGMLVFEDANAARKMRETLITASHRPMQSLTQQFDADERLGVIFRLASQLNGLTEFDEILERIMDATFEAFGAANFFALTLLDEDPQEDYRPLITRRRGQVADTNGVVREDEDPIFSKSIINRVIETQESVLFVRDSLGSELSQSIIDAKITACLCAPLVGQHSLLGVIEVDTRGQGSLFSKKDLDLFSVVASLAAFTLERATLSENIVQIFESFVTASVNAIDSRDPATAGHSERVTLYTLALAEAVNDVEDGPLGPVTFSEDELTELRYATMLHDFGKIGVSEATINKEMRLTPMHLELVGQRFETIKALTFQHILERKIQSLGDAEALSRDLHAEVRREHTEFCAELDDQYDALKESARAGYLQDDALARVQQLAERTYIAYDGVEHPYLTAFELRNMSIRRGTLNDEEWAEMRAHPAYSRDFLEKIPWSKRLENIPFIAGAHHEKLDGTGYPERLTAEQLPTQVRIMTIADIFDALTANDRPYRKAASVDRAVSILKEEAELNKLDAHLVDLFVDKVIPSMLHIIPSLQR